MQRVWGEADILEGGRESGEKKVLHNLTLIQPVFTEPGSRDSAVSTLDKVSAIMKPQFE